MKFWPVKKYNTILKYVLTAITVTLLLVVAIFRWDTVKNVFAGIVNIFEPIIWGAVIAFIMNPIMMSTEKFLKRFVFRKKPRPKAARAIGVLVATAVFLALITMIILSVIPEIASNIPDIYNGIVNFLPKAQEWAESVLNDIPSVREIVVNELSDIGATLQGILAALVPQINNFLTSLLDFADSVKNFVFGIIVAIYFLLSKETLQAQAKKMMIATMSEESCARLFGFVSNTNTALLNFIYGKVIDSIIIGLLCCVGMLIFRMPYVMLVSIIIGITNIIPIFGPFIGAIPSAILILIADPKKVIWFLIFIVALQQLDGNIIGPRILGSRIGLSPFWMLFSIIVFGSMFGIAGMIIGVPLFAVFYDELNGYIKTKLEQKNLPTEDAAYSSPGMDMKKISQAGGGTDQNAPAPKADGKKEQ